MPVFRRSLIGRIDVRGMSSSGEPLNLSWNVSFASDGPGRELAGIRLGVRCGRGSFSRLRAFPWAGLMPMAWEVDPQELVCDSSQQQPPPVLAGSGCFSSLSTDVMIEPLGCDGVGLEGGAGAGEGEQSRSLE